MTAAKAHEVQLGRRATINGRTAEIQKLKAQGLGLRATARGLGMPMSSAQRAFQSAA